MGLYLRCAYNDTLYSGLCLQCRSVHLYKSTNRCKNRKPLLGQREGLYQAQFCVINYPHPLNGEGRGYCNYVCMIACLLVCPCVYLKNYTLWGLPGSRFVLRLQNCVGIFYQYPDPYLLARICAVQALPVVNVF